MEQKVEKQTQGMMGRREEAKERVHHESRKGTIWERRGLARGVERTRRAKKKNDFIHVASHSKIHFFVC